MPTLFHSIVGIVFLSLGSIGYTSDIFFQWNQDNEQENNHPINKSYEASFGSHEKFDRPAENDFVCYPKTPYLHSYATILTLFLNDSFNFAAPKNKPLEECQKIAKEIQNKAQQIEQDYQWGFFGYNWDILNADAGQFLHDQRPELFQQLYKTAKHTTNNLADFLKKPISNF